MPGPPLYRGLMITLTDTPHSIGFLWTSILPTQTTTWQKTKSQQTGILSPSLIQTRNYSKRAAAYAGLRQRGYWDRLSTCSRFIYSFIYLHIFIYSANFTVLSGGSITSMAQWLLN